MTAMRKEYNYDSCGAGQIRACMWTPEQQPRAVVQLVHGIAEHIDRYDDFALWLNEQGILVVAEDHMGHGKSIGKDNKENKLTCIRLYGLEGAKVRAEMCAQDCRAVLEGVDGDTTFLNMLIDYVLKRAN